MTDQTDTDARRFRAIAGIPAAEMHGSAGVNPTQGGRLHPATPGQVHFGARLSAVPAVDPTTPAGDPVADAGTLWARHAVRALAEDVIATEGGTVPASGVGESSVDDARRWAALMRAPRIRLMDHDDTSLRAEFWASGQPHASGQDDPVEARRLLTDLADIIVARQTGERAIARN